MTIGGVEVQDLVARLDAVSNALATVDAHMERMAIGLFQIEKIARTAKMEHSAILAILEIVEKL